MSTSATLTLKNRLSELERVSHVVESFGARHALPAKTVFEISLALDEILTNVISYAYADDAEHEIGVRLAVADGDVTVEVEDDGRPFNPLQVAAPPLHAPIAQRPAGGLGIHLVRQLSSRVEYHRRDDRNVLRITKSVERTGDGESRMRITEAKRDGSVIVTVAGRLDNSNAGILEAKLVGRIDSGERHVVIDAARLDYISSAGLRVLLMTAKRLSAAGGMMVLAALTEHVKEVLDIAGFSSILTIYPSADEAVARMK